MPFGAMRHGFTYQAAGGAPSATFVPASDSYSSALALAAPMNSVTQFNDVSHLVSGSPNSVACIVRPPQSTTSAEIVTDDYKYYGSSMNSKSGGGSQYKLYYDLQDSFYPHSENYTIEFWFKTTRTLNNSWMISNADVGGRILVGFYQAGGSVTNISIGEQRVPVSAGWHHVAIQRDYWYLDGTRKGTVSEPTLSSPISRLYFSQQVDSDANDWEGYLNDLRVYIGVNKYTGTTITPPDAMGTIVT